MKNLYYSIANLSIYLLTLNLKIDNKLFNFDTMREYNSNSLKYLTVASNDESWGLVVTTVGEQSIAPHSSYPAMQHPTAYNLRRTNGRTLDEYQLIYITEGGGFFESESVARQRVVAGTVILLFPNEWHNYAPDEQSGWSEFWIGFKGNLADSVVAGGFFSVDEPLIDIGPSNSLMALYRDAIRLAEKEAMACQQLISGIVLHMLGHILYKHKNRSTGSNYAEDIINEARQLMRERAHHTLRAEDIAQSLGVGYSWFRQNFKRLTGTSPVQYISRILMSRAKELLVTESCSIAEVAYTLGFENAGQFSTAFRKMEGITPRQFRDGNYKI